MSRVAAGLVCVLACCVLAACGNDKKQAKRDRTVPVTVVAVACEDTPVTLNAVGNVAALASVEIKSRVGGIIEEQLVQDGQDVEKGDLLFRIDARPFELAIKEAQAQIDRDQAHLDNARKALERYSQLRLKNVVAQEQYDSAYTEVVSLENTIRLNQAALEKAKLDREYASITAPIPGRVGIVRVNLGNVIKANDDRTLCVINQIRPINISFTLPERYLGEILKRMAQGPLRVGVAPPGAQGRPTEAELVAVDNAVDTTTGTIRLLASYANEDHRFWPGQFVRVELDLYAVKDALLLPTGAVLQGMKGPYVYVATRSEGDPSAGVVQARDITTSHIVGERTIVESGLKQGELVVLDGQIGLSPGARVAFKKGASEGAKQ